ncbi:hypothetical protein K450DRAFT_303671 [Umbelopsis ramanniana AG]|uniref:Topoisomerase 6 subunit A/Spo11 TOPRIM domain-containing protein n=1 Tax=Umbelopsis ramanniana AG TaxID=1314678 RepID=A0AAD5E1Q7_UMBRA|nr:uncharacterized protein K450DRAFT_303671 [Umbelopsis ramanniana AG]KAI8575269.1 hypothetical protein K450DRAFT_303671 [Umbelopsis ramanniana AG]
MAASYAVNIHQSSMYKQQMTKQWQVDSTRKNLGVPIPFEGSIQRIQCKATNVLVVEKEGKGYPCYQDVATRYLLNMISTANRCCAMSDIASHTIKIWSLIDGDPHGIDIHVVYKWGGRSKYHHNEILTCPDIQWLGIHSQDLKSRELSYILHQNVKYELEALCSIDNQGLLLYLQRKIWQEQL